MGNPAFARAAIVVAGVAMTVACKGGDKPAPAATASAAPVPSTAADEGESAPGPCRAKGDKPTALATITGDVFGFEGDSTELYYSSWEIYGQRGDVGAVRKDGGGAQKLTSLDLEPRGLAIDDERIYYTSGIRLMSIPKRGGDPTAIAPQFSAQHIAAHGADVFGVPGDYGPYDRVARVPKKGGDTKELSTAKRPQVSVPPNGFSRLFVDDSGVFIADTGNGRILRFPLDGRTPQVLAAHQDKAFDLALVGTTVYFSLARKGDLLAVSTAGGPVKKIASGLVENARIAAEGPGLYSTFGPRKDGEALSFSRVAPESGEIARLADVPPIASVSRIALDGRCVYWVVRETSSKSVVYALGR